MSSPRRTSADHGPWRRKAVRQNEQQTTRTPRALVHADGWLSGCEGYAEGIRARNGERLEQLFERSCDEHPDAIAIDGPEGRLSYAELDARANQLARHLALRVGLEPGDRVALLFERPADGYVGMLATLKLHAAYVPLDGSLPAERVAFILADAQAQALLCVSSLANGLESSACNTRILYLDRIDAEIAGERDERLASSEIAQPRDELAYVIYTSGTTGRPKGVAVSHASICNFIRVAGEVYGVAASDRMYQGLTLAFDFSVEEIWIAWIVGATLVPRPGGPPLLGRDLHEFLVAHDVSALCCVPTLLTTLESDLPALRVLIVSGETCPEHVVERWHKPGRRLLNVYGPTEATVSATWTVLHPSRRVTIGVPLPTYTAVVLEPDCERLVGPGELGELGIAGVGVAQGYFGRPDLTQRAFVPDFLSLPNNPSGRIYRTGDMARINEQGEIEHHGRIDEQVKLRGYRVELSEIAAALQRLPGLSTAVVSTCEVAPGQVELVAYYCGDQPVDRAQVNRELRGSLPAYMVPAYLERIGQIPLRVSGKLDRDRLPLPTGARLGAGDAEITPPSSELEAALARELAALLGLDRVSVGARFDDLGASSLTLAHFAARVRAAGRPPVSIRELYLHPTVAELALALEGAESAAPAWREPEQASLTGQARYALAGALQLLAFVLYAGAGAAVFDVAGRWLLAAHGVLGIYGRSVAFGSVLVIGAGSFPIIAKWILIGRFRPQRIRVWSLAYVRFWIVKTLLVANPLAHMLIDTPLYALYLRALGARVSSRSVIFSRHIPVCTDLLRIGDGAVVLKDVYFNGYRARAGVIEFGPVQIGERAFVGERAVLDIFTTLESDSQLGHSSSLHAGQVVPEGQCWHGSPAAPAGPGDDYRRVAPSRLSDGARARYSAGRVLVLLGVAGPIEALAGALLLTHPGWIERLSLSEVLLFPAVVLAGALLASLALAVGVSRLLTRVLVPGRVYPLYGRHYAAQRLIARASNNPLLLDLFGDSAAVVHYLRAIGYRLGIVEQTGTNFGVQVHHEVPALSRVGTGTLVSDGLSLINAEFSENSFRTVPVTIGERNYLGNNVSFPAGARTGANCLLASKVLVPTSGPMRENVGLLGSPSFEIPRANDRAAPLTAGERRRALAAKARHNLLTATFFLLVLYVTLVGMFAIGWSPIGGAGLADWPGTTATVVLDLLFVIASAIAIERIVGAIHPVRPRRCSIYERAFWLHERYWKLAPSGYLRVLDGTPFKALAWRALGVRVGRRVFDDGLSIVERPLAAIGDGATFNMGAELQPHTLEDGVFESGLISVEAGCTLGTGALVNYDVVLGEGASVEADAFVVKGSRVAPGARWRGNPATEVPTGTVR